jgi:hypothetical protein
VVRDEGPGGQLSKLCGADWPALLDPVDLSILVNGSAVVGSKRLSAR